MSISALDSLLILGISVATGVVSEAVSWYLVYRTTAYKEIKDRIERDSRKRVL